MTITLQEVLPTYFEESRRQQSEIWGKQLTFNKGEYIKIVAPSGSGKSSLTHFLYGLRNEYNGKLLYHGQDLKGYSVEDVARYRKDHVSIVFQDLRLFPEQSVRDNLELKRQLNPYHGPEKITEMAERLGIGNKLSVKSRICSYGEQQRVAIIRALLQPFDFLLLDEPFSHLDDNNSKKAMALMLEEAAARGAGILFADLERIDFFPWQRLYHL